ncbi:hypothetical protein [Collimonas sp. OK607]|uniref:hypothetical protein n=1 Tax=Collimonas sp. OK607 TaxID=1798194 RepID=UPI0011140782|nr:hypothetical protein [Collimonas sp. OK607]
MDTSDQPIKPRTPPTNNKRESHDTTSATTRPKVPNSYEADKQLNKKKHKTKHYPTNQPAKGSICNSRVRTREETQGTAAMTINNPRAEATRPARHTERSTHTKARSDAAGNKASPTTTLNEKTRITTTKPQHSKNTTGAHSHVASSRKTEIKSKEVPPSATHKHGKPNKGNPDNNSPIPTSNPTQKDHINNTSRRSKNTQPAHKTYNKKPQTNAASKTSSSNAKNAKDASGGRTAAQGTKEETEPVQKLVRPTRDNKNPDTRPRAAQAQTANGWNQTPAETTGTQTAEPRKKPHPSRITPPKTPTGKPAVPTQMKPRQQKRAKRSGSNQPTTKSGNPTHGEKQEQRKPRPATKPAAATKRPNRTHAEPQQKANDRAQRRHQQA